MPLRLVCLSSLLLSATLAVANPVTLPDGGTYKGDLRDGLLHGQGSIDWPNGTSYRGEFRSGQMHGFGIFTHANGGRYEGDFAHGLFHGTGRYSQASGSTYVGRYENGDFREGKLEAADGTEAHGSFQHFQLHGRGQVTVPGQGTWIGTYESGQLVGIGEFKGEDGQEYVGEFEDWAFHGEGTLKRPDGAEYQGRFESGYFQGKGSYKDSTLTYEGGFEFGRYSGHGMLETSEGDSYEGMFEHGVYSGPGKLTTAGGDVFEGTFEWGTLERDGTVNFANGDHYRGELRRGELHGKGEMYQAATDSLIRGQWRHGEEVFRTDGEMKYLGTTAERALYRQTEVLNRALDEVASSDAGKIEMYFVGIGGDGSQRVFEREVRYAEKLLTDKYALESRSITLINSSENADVYPLATVTAIERTLNAIAQKMDPDQDILFLYMTSHGSKTHDFSLAQEGIDLPDLPAEYLAQIIRRLPVKHKVIGISACYSGGFIEPLKDDHTLIMTAARKDRQSFGCSDDAELTYFGRAFFERGLQTTFSLRDAFRHAFDLVSEWEEADGQKKSEPQIHAPETIIEYLENWYVTLPDYAPDRAAEQVLANGG